MIQLPRYANTLRLDAPCRRGTSRRRPSFSSSLSDCWAVSSGRYPPIQVEVERAAHLPEQRRVELPHQLPCLGRQNSTACLGVRGADFLGLAAPKASQLTASL